MKQKSIRTTITLASMLLALSATAQTPRVKLELVGTLPVPEGSVAHAVAVAGNRLCVAWANEYTAHIGAPWLDCGGIDVVDATDIAQPRRLGRCPLPAGAPVAVQLVGDYAYVPASGPSAYNGIGGLMWYGYQTKGYLGPTAGFSVIDLSIPTAPCIRTDTPYQCGGDVRDMVVAGSHLYLLHINRLTVLSLAEPARPVAVGEVAIDRPARALCVSGEGTEAHAFIAYDGLDGPGFSPGGVKVVDLSDPTRPQESGDYFLSGIARAIDVTDPRGDALICVDGAVRVVGHTYGIVQDFRGYACDVQVVNHLAFISDSERAVVVVDLSADPPSVVGRFATQGRVHSLQVVGDHAFVAAGEQGLLILRITELPAITRTERTAVGLLLRWNDVAKGMTLQRATSLIDPDWQSVAESESTNRVTVPVSSGPEFFRLIKP